MRPTQPTRLRLLSLPLAVVLLASAGLRAEEGPLPSRERVEEELPEGSALTGREIYDRYLENRYRRSIQDLKVLSMDPGGSAQATVFKLHMEDYRDDEQEPTDGVLAKSLMEVSHPFDMRHTAYLMIAKDPGPDDEFVYQPSERRVHRTDLKNTPLMGTDYSFDDLSYYELDDAEYRRLPDEEIDGTPVYVVEAIVEESREVSHHRTISYLEKEHYVPIRVRYWDEFGVEIKELTAPPEKIQPFGDVWVATESTMRDLLQGTSSMLLVRDVKLDPEFPANLFSVARLQRGH